MICGIRTAKTRPKIHKACHPLVQILFEGEGGDSPEEQSH